MEFTTSAEVKPLVDDYSEIPYELAARYGENMPEGLDVADQFLFLSLRMLYGSLRLKIVGHEWAKKERFRLIRKSEELRFRDGLSKGWEASIRRTEAARAAYRKERTLENADLLLAAVEGL